MVTRRCRPCLRKALTSACLSICVVALMLAGCGAGAGSGTSGNNIVVSITNKIASVQAGTAAIAFVATVQNDSSSSGVTWSLTANGVACAPACGTLSALAAGTVLYNPPISAPAAPNNQPTLTATSVAKTNKSDSDAFAISAALLVSITNKFASVNTGFSPFVVNATVQNDPTNSGVSWTLTANGAACTPACGSLSGATATSVTYTPPKSAPATQPSLTAISVHDGSKFDVDNFSISVAPISVSIGDKIRTAYAGSNAIFFNANVANDPSASGVTWTLTTNGASCTSACGTISANQPGQFGTFYTPPATVPTPSSVTLSAVSNADGTKSDVDAFTISALPPVSITITQLKSVLAGTSGVNFSASIQNDPSSTPSVTWALTLNGSSCALSTCGTLTSVGPTSVTYVPPSSPVSSVQITATSSYDANKSALDTFDVISTVSNSCGAAGGQESLLNGHYALLVQGFWGGGSGTPLMLAASFAANGSGSVTAADEDINDTISPQYLTLNSTGSLYTVGADHRGCLQLTYINGTTTVFHFALGGIVSGVASKGRIIEFDDNSLKGAGSRGSGILRLQDATAFALTALKPQYAFGVEGWTESGTQFALMSGAGSFSNSNGALTGVFDQNSGGILAAEATNVTGNIGSISTSSGRASANFPQFVFDWEIYVINSSEFFIIGIDPINNNPLSIGRAVATGNSFTASSLSGSYVVHATGNTNGSADGNLQLLAMTPGGAQTGTFSGTVDSYGGGNAARSTTLSGVTYNVDPSSGRTTLGNPTDNLPIFYLTTPTDGISAFVVGVGPDALFGAAEQQTGSTLAAGTYIFGTGEPSDNTVPNRLGVETLAAGGAITGTFDQSSTSGLQSNQGLSATLSLGSNGAGNVGSNTVAMTSGGKLFSIDETGGTSGAASIVVAEQ